MKRKRFTKERIIGVLKEAAAGATTLDLCRRHGVAPPCRTQSVRLPSGRPLERRPGLIAGGVEPHADKPGQRYAVADICRFDRLATTIAGLPAASSDFTEPIRCRARQSTTSRLLYGQYRAQFLVWHRAAERIAWALRLR